MVRPSLRDWENPLDFWENPLDFRVKLHGLLTQRGIPPWVERVYPLALKGYTPLAEKGIPFGLKGVYPFV